MLNCRSVIGILSGLASTLVCDLHIKNRLWIIYVRISKILDKLGGRKVFYFGLGVTLTENIATYVSSLN